LEDASAKMLAYLVEAFPSCFFLYGNRRQPLKIGIFDDLLPLVPFAADDLKAALRRYTRPDGYLRACVEGAVSTLKAMRSGL
jgi:sRNA-binding protein